MKFLSVFFVLTIFFAGCGSSSSEPQKESKTNTTFTDNQNNTKEPTQSENSSLSSDNTIEESGNAVITSEEVEDSLNQVKNDAENIVPIEDTETTEIVTEPKISVQKEHSVTVYIHGYDDQGTAYQNTYGYDAYDPMLNRLVELTGFDTLQTYNPNNFTNVITITPYYGQKAPSYYTQKDIDEVEAVTHEYGGGIPRYALIIAKYAKHVMKITGADHVNFISASMGSLIARWIIEKDVEHLASEKKILRWQTLEGVIRGNKLASDKDLVKFANTIQEQPIDVEQMSYQWIEQYLHNPREEAASKYYKDIVISEISSTKPGEPFDWLMLTTPNDGYQAVKDTYFETIRPEARHNGQVPTHTFFHQTHLGLKKDDGAWANVATFLLPHKRVQITLTEAKVDDIHESYLNGSGEIVFESLVYSPYVEEIWSITDAISERVYDSGALPVYKYKKDGQTKVVNQILYDDYVLKDENQLKLKLSAYEIDQNLKYGVHDGFGKYERLGSASLLIDLVDNTYTINARDWSGIVRVKIVEN